MKTFRAFTLIELLIVVAIIAILAAIAVPNFLEAQVRAKVSRCKNEMRAVANALESYRVDSNRYPPDPIFYGGIANQWLSLFRLSTPTAYISSVPGDLFVNKRTLNYATAFRDSQLGYYAEPNYSQKWGRDYVTRTGPVTGTGTVNFLLGFGAKETGLMWSLASFGPDRWDNYGHWHYFGGDEYLNNIPALLGVHHGAIYDPTNGTISDGDIVRSGP